MDLATLSGVLWREREMLETLLFKLDEQRLLLAAGLSEWLIRASEEVEAVLARVSEIELRRAIEFDRAAAVLGLAPNPSLRALAAAAPEPWGHLLDEHQRAFTSLTARIQQASDANRELAASAQRVTDSVIAGIRGGGDEGPLTYVPTGQAGRSAARSALLDEEI